MPDTKRQKRTACMVLAMREGKLSKEKFPRVAGMFKNMSDDELRDYCQTEVKK